MGRPKKLNDKDYVEIEKLAKLGLTKEMIADHFDYSYSTMYEDKRFSEVYKRGYAELGRRVRTTLLAKMENDTTSAIYLDKVINKTTEKAHDDNIVMKKENLELEKEKLKLDKDIFNETVKFVGCDELED